MSYQMHYRAIDERPLANQFRFRRVLGGSRLPLDGLDLRLVGVVMRRNGEGWLISDIYLDGAVSEVATRRTECAFHIRDGRHWTAEYGIERKIELLRVAVVKSF